MGLVINEVEFSKVFGAPELSRDLGLMHERVSSMNSQMNDFIHSKDQSIKSGKREGFFDEYQGANKADLHGLRLKYKLGFNDEIYVYGEFTLDGNGSGTIICNAPAGLVPRINSAGIILTAAVTRVSGDAAVIDKTEMVAFLASNGGEGLHLQGINVGPPSGSVWRYVINGVGIL